MNTPQQLLPGVPWYDISDPSSPTLDQLAAQYDIHELQVEDCRHAGQRAKTEVPATADHLKALHSFSEEVKEALGLPSLYNESLGTVSESYHYDRVEDRDKPQTDRPKRPWQAAAAGAKKNRA